jgi:hypothetical protein
MAKIGGKIALIGEGNHFVADSFAHFVELELNDDPTIHPGAAAKSQERSATLSS